MQGDILNPRRALRVTVRCAVEIRHRFITWRGETEDIGPRGCQIVTARVLDPGREVKLAIRSDAVGRTVGVKGKVIWSRREAPSRLGISFERGIEKRWLDEVMTSDPAAERAARVVPDRLARRMRLYLGRPPNLVVDFTPTELEILHRVGPGVTLDALARSFGPELHERIRGTLFSLFTRRFLVTDPASSVGVAPWASILSDGERAALHRPAHGARRPLEAQRLYDEALAHIGAGRFGLAVDRLHDALRLSPEDETIASTAKRLARWV